MRLALIQPRLSADPEDNLRQCEALVRGARADLIVLPEAFVYPFGTPPPTDPGVSAALKQRLSALARESGAVLVGGTIPEITPEGAYNTACVFGPDGALLGAQRKIHLFDVDLPGRACRESDKYRAGESIRAVKTPLGTIGVGVCFDLRFPELFITCAAQGARLVVVPAAFLADTAKKHWALLLRARALDSQCFVAGCAPAQNPAAAFPVYGHSALVGPDGDVRAALSGEAGVLTCTIDLADADRARRKLPVLSARRPGLYTK